MHTIKCPNCGEEYAASYKRCPFCDDRQPTSRSSSSGSRSGGKRLAVNRKKRRFWRRVFFFLSLILIIAAICIVVSIVRTLFGEKGANEGVDTPPSIEVSASPTPSSAQGDGTLTGIALNPSEINLATVRDTQQLTAVPTPANAAADVTWQSSNPAVATVNESGLVTAVSNGTATITATSTTTETITASCVVTVGSSTTSPAPSGSQTSSGSPKINKTDFTLFSAGETCQLKVTGVSGPVEWSIENSAIATISSDGLVTAVATGMTKVTAQADGQTFSCIVRVK